MIKFALILTVTFFIQTVCARHRLPTPNWILKTEDTQLTIGVTNNHPVVYELRNTRNGWNWIKEPSEMPFPEKVKIGTSTHHPDWKYQDAKVEESNGIKLILHFLSTTPKLMLESVWEARPGVGPVENSVSIKNNSGESISFQDADVISANINLTADSTITLWRFNKGRYLGNKSLKDKPIVNVDQIRKNDTLSYYLPKKIAGTLNAFPSLMDTEVVSHRYDL